MAQKKIILDQINRDYENEFKRNIVFVLGIVSTFFCGGCEYHEPLPCSEGKGEEG